MYFDDADIGFGVVEWNTSLVRGVFVDMGILFQDSIFNTLTRGLGADSNSGIVFQYLEKMTPTLNEILCWNYHDRVLRKGLKVPKLKHIKDLSLE